MGKKKRVCVGGRVYCVVGTWTEDVVVVVNGDTVPCGWALPGLTGPEWGRGKDDTLSESAPCEFEARLKIEVLEMKLAHFHVVPTGYSVLGTSYRERRDFLRVKCWV